MKHIIERIKVKMIFMMSSSQAEMCRMQPTVLTLPPVCRMSYMRVRGRSADSGAAGAPLHSLPTRPADKHKLRLNNRQKIHRKTWLFSFFQIQQTLKEHPEYLLIRMVFQHLISLSKVKYTDNKPVCVRF